MVFSADTAWYLQACFVSISYDSFLLKEYVTRTQGSQCLERDCLEYHDERFLKPYYCMKFFS